MKRSKVAAISESVKRNVEEIQLVGTLTSWFELNMGSKVKNINCFVSPAADSRDCKEEKDLHLSDLDDMDEDDCDKLQSHCEKVVGEQGDLQRAPVGPGGPHRRDCGSELQLNVTDSFQGFACSLKPPLPSDFLEPMVPTKAPPSSSSSSSLVLAGTPSLSHFEAADKPRIWSLARTAASGVLLSPELRSADPGADCQLQDEPVLAQAHSLFPQGGATLHHKLYGATAGYGHKDVQLHCSTYSLLPDACQYSTGPGTASHSQSLPENLRRRQINSCESLHCSSRHIKETGQHVTPRSAHQSVS